MTTKKTTKTTADTALLSVHLDAPAGHRLVIDGITIEAGETVELTSDQLARCTMSGATVILGETTPEVENTDKGQADNKTSEE